MRALLAATLLMITATLLACGGRGDEPGEQSGGQRGEMGVIEGSVTLAGRAVGDQTGVLIFCAGTNHIAFSNAQGTFRFTGLPFATYDLHARHDGFEQTPLGQVTLSAGQPRAGLAPRVLAAVGQESVVLPNLATGSLVGNFSRQNQEYAGDINVSVQGTPHATITDSQGRWMLHEIPSGQYVLAVTATGHQSLSLNVEVTGDEMNEVPPGVLRPGSGEQPMGSGVIQGIVAIIGPEDSLVAMRDGVMLTLVESGDIVFPDNEGFFQFRDLPTQRHTLTARGPGLLFGEPLLVDLAEGEIAEVTVFLDLIETEVESDAGGLEGRLILPGGDAAVGTLVSVVGSSHVTTTDEQGVFHFEGVAAGTATLMVREMGYERIRRSGLQVVAGEVLDVGDIQLELSVDAPHVVNTEPESGARDVLLRPEIPVIVRFSEAMDAATVRGAIQIDPEVPFRVLMGGEHSDASETEAVILIDGFSNEIDFRQRVTVTIDASAKSLEGVALADEAEIEFTIGRPGIYRSNPESGSDGHRHQRRISLYFNTVIEDQRMAERIRIRPEPPVVPNVWVEEDAETGWSIVCLQGVLSPSTEYHLEVTQRLRTEGGTRLGSAREIDFKTGAETVIGEYGKPTERDSDYLVY